MTENNKNSEQKPKRRRRSQSPLLYYLIFCGVVGCFFLYFLYLEKSGISPSGPDRHDAEQAVQESHDNTGTPAGSTIPTAAPTGVDGNQPVPPDPIEKTIAHINSLKTAADEAGDLASLGTLLTADEELSRVCNSSLTTISDFYHHLDQQDYLKPYQLGQPSDAYFSTLIQKVVDNPPIVTGETDDLFNILKNTAHFFRIVGKKNIFILKAILDREKDSFEKVLADFYNLTAQPKCLQEGFSLNIKQEALYDYAGFFLNTMGGRLYLFRRDSVSRMAVSYYSILIVDNANQTGTNKHGIDIVPAIDTLISELENSGAQLRLKDDYLDSLYDLKEKYM